VDEQRRPSAAAVIVSLVANRGDAFTPRRQQLATAAQLCAVGVGRAALSRAVAAGDLTRVARKVYAPSPLAPMPLHVVTDKGVAAAYVRHVRAVLLSLGDKATAAGRTAAALRGWGMLIEPGRTIEVAVPHGRPRSRVGVTITQRRTLARSKVMAVSGTELLWATAPVQTVLDCCLGLPMIEAVVISDSALRSGEVSLAELRVAARRLPGVRDAARVRRVLRFADPSSGSVLESVLRVHLHLAGIAGFTSQYTVRVADGVLHRVDFCFSAARLIVETDGAKWHPDPGPDRVRDNALAAAGFRVLRYTWADVVHNSSIVVAEIQAAAGAGTGSIQLAPQAAQPAA
jgi:very-short-patch-repair endonuclease